MTERKRQDPPKERTPRAQDARRAREAEALRANLRRRKEQARARKGEAAFARDPGLR